MTQSRNDNRKHRTRRIRAKVQGSALRPRVSILRTLGDLRVQLIDDENNTTVLSAVLKDAKAKNTVDGAGKLGSFIADACKKAKIETVVFDRSGYAYHGKVKALAEALREGGVQM